VRVVLCFHIDENLGRAIGYAVMRTSLGNGTVEVFSVNEIYLQVKAKVKTAATSRCGQSRAFCMYSRKMMAKFYTKTCAC
jgi:hypothetical protein